VEEEGITVGDESLKESLKVAGDLWIRAFIDEQRRARVRKDEGTEAAREGNFLEDTLKFLAQGDQRSPVGTNGQGALFERDAHF
jgi:hypothetical protein